MNRIRAQHLLVAALVLLPLAAHAERLRPVMSVYMDEKGGALKYPEGVACDGKGTVIVADTANGRLLRYREEEGALKGGTDIRAAQLLYPTRVQLNSKGEIFALDGKQRRIARFNPDGKFLGLLDPQGIPAPAGFVPLGFKIDAADSLYLLDVLNERVIVLDGSGKFQRQVPFPKPYHTIADVAVSAGGDLYLLDSVGAALFVARKGENAFAPLGKPFPDKADFATYLAVDPRGGLVAVDHDGGAVVTLGADGTFTGRVATYGWKEGQLRYPGQICFGGTGSLVIADRDNSRVQLFEAVK